MQKNTVQLLSEAKDYFSCYVDAKTDEIKFSARQSLRKIRSEILIIVGLSGFMISAVIFLMSGVAMALGETFGGRLWVGYTITGAVVLFIVMILPILKQIAARKKSLKQKVKDYEQQLQTQRKEYGHSIIDQAVTAKCHD